MKWLEQHRRERRWWASSASLAVLSLVLGVLGVVPVVAESSGATCVADEANGLSVAWSDLPEGLELILLAQTDDGELHTVHTGNPGDVVGYGASGAWSGLAYPGAVAYALHSDPTLGGGSIGCALTRADDGRPDDSIAGRGGDDGADARSAADRVCTGAKVDVTTQSPAITVDAPEGFLIARYCVKAASAEQGEGPEYVDVEPPASTVTMTHSSGKDVSHYSLSLEEAPPPGGDDGGDYPSGQVADLAARIDVVCASGAALVTVTLTNTGGRAGTAQVTIDDTETISVAPGATETVIGSVSETGPVAVLVEDETGAIIGAFQAVDVCVDPAPELLVKSALSCESLEIEVLALNSGTADGVVHIEAGGGTVALGVPAGGHVVHVVPVTVGETLRVTAHDGTKQLLDVAYEEVCEQPEPELEAAAAVDCAAAKVTVTISNAGDLEGTAAIMVDGQEVTTVAVAPGARLDRAVAFDPATAHVLSVVSDGATVALLHLDIAPCTTPEPDISATADLDCESGTIDVLLENVGDAPGTAEVTINGDSETIVVPAGGTVERGRDLDIGGSTDVRVVVDGVVVVDERTDDTCVVPEAVIVPSTVLDCANGQIVIRLENGGEVAGGAVVTVNGVSQAVTVAAGETLRVFGELTLDGDITVDVAVDGASILSETRMDACAVPEGSVIGTVDVSCTGGGATVVVSNGRSEDTAVVQTVNGEDQMFIVPAGTVVERAVALTEDASYDISIATGELVLGSASGTFDCENAEVRAKTKKKEPDELTELPRTGAANTAMLASAGVALLATGLVATRASVIRRERLAETRSR